MYINIDAPPPPTGPVSIVSDPCFALLNKFLVSYSKMRTDSHALQPKLNASFVSVRETDDELRWISFVFDLGTEHNIRSGETLANGSIGSF